MRIILLLLILLAHPLLAEKTIIRVGHFPNISHAQGMIGHHLTRQNKGWFEERLGPDVTIEWYVFDSGPSAMEALFAGSLDITYVGPSPTINAFVKSKGEEVRVISGACSGGAALVVQGDGRIKTVEDFKGKKVATPSFGNTQDVSARTWLKSKGYQIKLGGGDVYVVPTAPSDQLQLFKKGQLDAAWAIEPWVSRLIVEGNGKVFFYESTLWRETQGKYVTTNLVSSKEFLKKYPELIKKWLKGHVELTDWINEKPGEAKEMVREEFKAETRIALSKDILDKAWDNLEFTYDPVAPSLFKYAEEAKKLGFISGEFDIKAIYNLSPLNEVLKEKGKKPIE